MPQMNEELLSAMQVIQGNPTAKRTFQVIEKEGGKASGWKIAKSQDVDPNSVQVVLQMLKNLRVIESQGTGLEGYYYLTSLGFQLREFFPDSLAR